ncbi:interleukin-10 receptor subunit beta-like, partial [Empidonax traillii]|uniref:interleukin-10 receptor subunit beta-like n=1 Tax=Empidonax traillii TaxID=164674 RepID=UPI000FFD0F4A
GSCGDGASPGAVVHPGGSLLSLCLFPATLGPPKVNRVSASSDSLLLSVSPPFTPEPGDSFQYRVFYWENSTSTTRKEQEAHKTLLQIEKLKESTLYCFSLQVEFEGVFGNLLGQESTPRCHRTAVSEATRAVQITLLCLLGLVLVNLATAGLLFLWKHHQKIKQWAQPPLKIPSHFEEFLRDPTMPGLEELDSSMEDEPQVVGAGEGIQAWSSSPG